MTLRLVLGCLLIQLCAVPLLAQSSNIEIIMNRHFKARGGIEKLKTVNSIRMTGVRVLSPSPLELPIILELQRPNKMREELTVQGMLQITNFDGKDGWIKTSWAANKEAEPLSPEELKGLSESEFDSPYQDWQAKGWVAEYLGRNVVVGRKVHQIRFAVTNTRTIIASFDETTFQEVQREQILRSLGNEIKFRSIFDDYKMVQGISFPFYIDHRAMYRGRNIRLILSKVDVNPELNETRFTKP